MKFAYRTAVTGDVKTLATWRKKFIFNHGDTANAFPPT